MNGVTMTTEVKIQQDGRLLRLTFNRPEDNAVTDGMALAVSKALDSAHLNSDAVLISSIGPDFCTGRKRNADAPPPSPEAYERRAEYDSIFGCYQAIRNCKVPVIVAVEGRVMGFGAAITALADVSFASDTAQFNIPEIEHNVMPTMVMSALYDRINRNAVLYMAYTAAFIDAHEAQRLGFTSKVFPAQDFTSEVASFIEVLLSRPRPAILGLKEYTHHASRMDEAGAIDYARSLHSMVNTSAAMKKKAH
jgi:enoyl-CoA hydratase